MNTKRFADIMAFGGRVVDGISSSYRDAMHAGDEGRKRSLREMFHDLTGKLKDARSGRVEIDDALSAARMHAASCGLNLSYMDKA